MARKKTTRTWKIKGKVRIHAFSRTRDFDGEVTIHSRGDAILYQDELRPLLRKLEAAARWLEESK